MRSLIWLPILVPCSLVALSSLGAAAPPPELPCTSTTIAKIAMPVGPAAYESGRMTLANGATLQLSGPSTSPEMSRVSRMKAGDPVAVCYGALTTYADAGPSRTITLLDLRNNLYYGTLVGTWPSASPSP